MSLLLGASAVGDYQADFEYCVSCDLAEGGSVFVVAQAICREPLKTGAAVVAAVVRDCALSDSLGRAAYHYQADQVVVHVELIDSSDV